MHNTFRHAEEIRCTVLNQIRESLPSIYEGAPSSLILTRRAFFISRRMLLNALPFYRVLLLKIRQEVHKLPRCAEQTKVASQLPTTDIPEQNTGENWCTLLSVKMWAVVVISSLQIPFMRFIRVCLRQRGLLVVNNYYSLDICGEPNPVHFGLLKYSFRCSKDNTIFSRKKITNCLHIPAVYRFLYKQGLRTIWASVVPIRGPADLTRLVPILTKSKRTNILFESSCHFKY